MSFTLYLHRPFCDGRNKPRSCCSVPCMHRSEVQQMITLATIHRLYCLYRTALVGRSNSIGIALLRCWHRPRNSVSVHDAQDVTPFVPPSDDLSGAFVLPVCLFVCFSVCLFVCLAVLCAMVGFLKCRFRDDWKIIIHGVANYVCCAVLYTLLCSHGVRLLWCAVLCTLLCSHGVRPLWCARSTVVARPGYMTCLIPYENVSSE